MTKLENSTEGLVLAVLDRTAIRSYGRGHVHVGELLNEIADDGGLVGVPTVALLAAHADLVDDHVGRARLRLLTSLPATAVMELRGDAAVDVADVVHFAGDDLARAHAAWSALKYAALLLTTEPSKSIRAVAEDRIVMIPTEDA